MAMQHVTEGKSRSRRRTKEGGAAGAGRITSEHPGEHNVHVQDPLAARGRVLGEFRAPEVCELTGISYRQLDYWTRTGLIQPGIKTASGSGTRRLYSFKDLVLIKTIKGLIEAGMSLQKVREAIDYIRNAMTRDPSELTLIATEGSILIFGPGEEAQLVDALRGGQTALSIALGPLFDQLQERVSEMEKAKRRHPSRDSRYDPSHDRQLRLFDE